MKLFQFTDPTGAPETPQRVGLIDAESAVDLTSCPPHPTSIYEIYTDCGGRSVGLEEAVLKILAGGGNPRRFNLADLLENLSDPDQPRLQRPVSPPPTPPTGFGSGWPV